MVQQGKAGARGKLTLGQRAADALTTHAGSWWFIGIFAFYLLVWLCANLYLLSRPFDPYPFILLNLTLSCLAAIQAPVILMSQNRAAERDRAQAKRDYYIDRKAERGVLILQRDLVEVKGILLKQPQTEAIDNLERKIEALHEELSKLGTE